jgi:hypothetical protein
VAKEPLEGWVVTLFLLAVLVVLVLVWAFTGPRK